MEVCWSQGIQLSVEKFVKGQLLFFVFYDFLSLSWTPLYDFKSSVNLKLTTFTVSNSTENRWPVYTSSSFFP